MSSDDDLGKCSLKNKTSSGGNIFNIENSYGGIPQVGQMQVSFYRFLYNNGDSPFALPLYYILLSLVKIICADRENPGI